MQHIALRCFGRWGCLTGAQCGPTAPRGEVLYPTYPTTSYPCGCLPLPPDRERKEETHEQTVGRARIGRAADQYRDGERNVSVAPAQHRYAGWYGRRGANG